jgi:hypothetical protein
MNGQKRLVTLGLVLLVWTQGVVGASVLAQPEADSDESKPSPRESYLGLALYIQQAFIEHNEIEQRIADFQADNDLSGNGQIEIGIAYARRNNIAELVWGFTSSSIDFMVVDHFFSSSETHVLLWYRRMFKFSGHDWVSFSAGLGLGYSWAWASVGRQGDSEDNSDGDQNAAVLAGSGLTYSAGLGIEFRLVEKSVVSIHAGLDYRYRIDSSISASTKNDGAAFFPGRAEFDFSGQYIGVGISLKKSKTP